MAAGDGVVRVKLPSGGWWDIRTRPLWKHVSDWRRSVRAGAKRTGLLERALVSLTTGWSFAEEVRPETLARREAGDLAAVLKVFCQRAESFAVAQDSAASAERLFAALAAGSVPPEFAEAHLMLATGWSWRDLQETPADVVDRTWTYLAVRQTRQSGGALEFASPPSKSVKG